MFKRLMERVVDFSVAKPWWIIGGALALTVFFAWQASTLKLAMTWMDMMPGHVPAVEEYKNLIKTFGTADQIMVVIDAKSEDQAIEMTERTAAELKKMTKWVKRLDYTVDDEFIKNHGLMLSELKDLKRFKTVLSDPNLLQWLTNLNNDFEKEYIEDDGNLKKDESQAAAQINALGLFADTLIKLSKDNSDSDQAVNNVVDRLTMGDKYFLSADRKMALLVVQPTFTADDTTEAYEGCLDMQAMVDKIEEDYPGTWIGLTGMSVIMKDEMQTAQEDSMLITLGAFLIITALFIITFRMWTSPLLAMLILVIGIIWDYGMAGMIIGKLTMFSAMSAILLIGLGVDYLMHFLSGFMEARVEGKMAKESILSVYHKSGKGILLGAITTSLVFFAMMLSDFPAMVEFGITVGLGILACMTVTLFVLPAIMVVRERHLLKKAKQGKLVRPFSAEFKFINKTAALAYKRPWLSITVMAGVTAVMILGIPRLGFDHNYLNIEAKGLESVKLYDVLEKRFDMSADALIFTTDTLEEAERKMYELDELVTVGQANSIAQYLPSDKSQNERRPYVKAIKKTVDQSSLKPVEDNQDLAEQIKRLNYNIIEMGQMGYMNGLTKLTKQCDAITGLDENGKQKTPNKLLQAEKTVAAMSNRQVNKINRVFYQRMKANVSSMANTNPIVLNDVRADIREHYISPDGKKYAVEAFSRKNVYKHMDDTSFIDDVLAVDERATGMPTIFKMIIDLSAKKGKTALALATVLIILLILIVFRNVKLTLLALLPMVLGYIFMFGTMGWIGMPLTIVSVMMLPLIVGIGIDDGIHLIHRHAIEGPGRLDIIIASTGKAIFLTTVTTVLGFGSLISAKYQGFAQMGWVTIFGVGWCFILSLIFIPTILKLMEGRAHHEKKN